MVIDTQRLKQKLFHLDVLIEKQEECYTAHCLQLDLITEGNTKAELWKIHDVVRVAIACFNIRIFAVAPAFIP